jgi:nitrate reductase gamma subunit
MFVLADIAAAVFVGGVMWRLLRWARARDTGPATPRSSVAAWVLAALDILFLRRLFAANKGLWVGEWVFHASFVLVMVRHVRYFFHPVPEVIVMLQPLGRWAGYALPASLLYILAYRFLVERAQYLSAYNLLITSTLLATGITGVLLTLAFRTDVVAAKAFILEWLSHTGWLAESAAPVPDSTLFLAHFLLALLSVLLLPSHIIAAPAMALEARRREESREGLLREES